MQDDYEIINPIPLCFPNEPSFHLGTGVPTRRVVNQAGEIRTTRTENVLESEGVYESVGLLQNGDLAAGQHAVSWLLASTASGVYVARLEALTRDGVVHRAAIRMVYTR